MVLEALVAIGLAGNIVQFVHFTCALLRKTREIHKSGSGKTPQCIELNDIAKQLQALDVKLNSDATEDGRIDVSNDMLPLAQHCKAVASELLAAIQDISIKSVSGRHDKWENFRAALKSVWKKEKIVELQDRLEGLRDQIMFCLVSRIDKRQELIIDSLKALSRENSEKNLSLVDGVQSIAEKLRLIENSLPSSDEGNQLEALRRQFSELSSIVRNVPKTGSILESLRFPHMRIRHSAIAEAHKRTFEWLFKTDGLPDDDPRSDIDLLEWLRNGHGIFWVTGKPGSGKSTLMKFLETHENLKEALQYWSGDVPLLRASYYFWNPGTEMQKSLQGLLQTLLYNILDACPDLVPTICEERWQCPPGSVMSTETWTTTELRLSLMRLKDLSVGSGKNFFFHVDGLDELNGDHEEIIAILQDLASCENVKLCLSSRPWNCFEAAFGTIDAQKLYLHTLTVEDIRLFAREQLTEQLRKTRFRMPRDSSTNLIQKIVDRAQGVFLWVRLVVRSLCEGLVNGDPPTLLHARLDAIPNDLETFFDLILNSVDPAYKERMASAFLVALRIDSPLKVTDYSFLDEEDRNFGLELNFKPLDDEEIEFRLSQTSRQLYGRYKGLLEPSRPGPVLQKHDTVDFLHRTLRDFLHTPKLQSKMSSWVSPDFDVSNTIARVLLADAKYANGPLKFGSFQRVLKFVEDLSNETGDKNVQYTTLDHIESVHHQLTRDSNGVLWTSELQGSMLKAAIHIQHIGYVKYRLLERGYNDDKNILLKHALLCQRELLNQGFNNALILTSGSLSCHYVASPGPNRISSIDERYLDTEMIEMLLDKGADPMANLHGQTIWHGFLEHSFMDARIFNNSNWHKLLELLLKHGADVVAHVDLWIEAFRCACNCATSLEGLLHTFDILFAYGLKPSHQFRNVTIFQSYLRMIQSQPNYGAYTESRLSIIRTFLRHGGNITDMSSDAAERSWFDYLLDILGICVEPIDPLSDFEVMLQHGFDPNLQREDGTVWEQVLSRMEQVDTTTEHRRQVWKATIILFLRYGADPRCDKLHRFLNRNGSEGSIFGSEAAEIEDVIKNEIAFVESRHKAALGSQDALTPPPSTADIEQSSLDSSMIRNRKRKMPIRTKAGVKETDDSLRKAPKRARISRSPL